MDRGAEFGEWLLRQQNRESLRIADADVAAIAALRAQRVGGVFVSIGSTSVPKASRPVSFLELHEIVSAGAQHGALPQHCMDHLPQIYARLTMFPMSVLTPKDHDRLVAQFRADYLHAEACRIEVCAQSAYRSLSYVDLSFGYWALQLARHLSLAWNPPLASLAPVPRSQNVRKTWLNMQNEVYKRVCAIQDRPFTPLIENRS